MTPCAVYSLVPRAGGHTLAGRARKLLEQSGFCAMPKVFANMEAPRPRVRLANDHSSRQLGASETLSPCVANAQQERLWRRKASAGHGLFSCGVC